MRWFPDYSRCYRAKVFITKWARAVILEGDVGGLQKFPHLVAFTFDKLILFSFSLRSETATHLSSFSSRQCRSFMMDNGGKLITLEQHFDSSFLWWEKFKVYPPRAFLLRRKVFIDHSAQKAKGRKEQQGNKMIRKSWKKLFVLSRPNKARLSGI